MPDDWVSHMVIVTLEPRVSRLGDICPDCRRKFKAGERIFESVDTLVAIHVNCVVGMALVAALRHPTDADVAAEFNARRDALLDTLARSTDDRPESADA